MSDWVPGGGFDEFMQDDVVKTGNGECGYAILHTLKHNLCGCNPSPHGGYEYCDTSNCPIKKGENNEIN